MQHTPSRIGFASVLFLAIVAGAACTPMQPPQPVTTARVPALEARIAQLCEARRAAKEVGALQIGILDGTHEWHRSFGEVETSTGRKAPDDRTLFEIGSISKTFTALLLADMVVRGEVRLEQPLASLLPRGTALGVDAMKAITLEQLSTHRSGLPVDWPGVREGDPHDPFAGFTESTLYAGLGLIHDLASAPGSAYAYNNYAVSLLGHVLARRLGLTYEQAIRARVTGPLAMNDTHVVVRPGDAARVVRGHDEVGTDAYNWTFGAIAPAGSIRSTLPDMLQYARALMRPNGALRDAIELAERPREDGPAPSISLGLGFHVLEAGRVTFHNGQASMHAFLAVDRSRSLAVVILSDRRGMAVDALGFDVLHLLRGDAPTPPAPPKVELDAAQRAALVGSYRLSPAMVIDIRDEAGVLTAQATGQGKNPLTARGPTELVITGTQIRLDFVLGADGSASSLTLHQNGHDTPAPREMQPSK